MWIQIVAKKLYRLLVIVCFVVAVIIEAMVRIRVAGSSRFLAVSNVPSKSTPDSIIAVLGKLDADSEAMLTDLWDPLSTQGELIQCEIEKVNKFCS